MEGGRWRKEKMRAEAVAASLRKGKKEDMGRWKGEAVNCVPFCLLHGVGSKAPDGAS